MTPARKYTDEQLSLILGECAAGHLVRHGAAWWLDRDCACAGGCDCPPACCINQAAFNEPLNWAAGDMWRETAIWFDDYPLVEDLAKDPSGPYLLLAELEAHGWA